MGLFSKAKPARRVGLRTCGFGAKLFGSQIGGNARNGCATLALSRAVATGLQALLSRFLRRRRSWHDPNGLPLWSSAPQKGRASHTVVLVRGAIDAARSTSQRAGARASARGLLGQCMGRSGGPAFSGASPSWAS